MNVKPVPAGDIPAVRMRLALIQQKALEYQALREELQRFLARACAADLVRETWELDEQHMLLVQRADANGAAPASEEYVTERGGGVRPPGPGTEAS